MPKIEYIPKNFRSDTLKLIATANDIIEDYQRRGYELTLRQLYYQLVARDYIPNNEKSYNKLGSTISNARNAGLVDWTAIVDRTRSRSGLSTWSSPDEIIKAAYQSFRIDKWKNQPYRLFVWVEKEALAVSFKGPVVMRIYRLIIFLVEDICLQALFGARLEILK